MEDGTTPNFAPLRDHYTVRTHARYLSGDLTWLDMLMERVHVVAACANEELLEDNLVELQETVDQWLNDLASRR